MNEPRKVYYIDVGDLPRAEVIKLMEKVKADLRASRGEGFEPAVAPPGLMNDVVETLAIAGSFNV